MENEATEPERDRLSTCVIVVLGLLDSTDVRSARCIPYSGTDVLKIVLRGKLHQLPHVFCRYCTLLNVPNCLLIALSRHSP